MSVIALLHFKGGNLRSDFCDWLRQWSHRLLADHASLPYLILGGPDQHSVSRNWMRWQLNVEFNLSLLWVGSVRLGIWHWFCLILQLAEAAYCMLYFMILFDPLCEIVVRILLHEWEPTWAWYLSCLGDRNWYEECLVESLNGILNLISGDDSFDDIPLLDYHAEWKVVLTVSSMEW